MTWLLPSALAIAAAAAAVAIGLHFISRRRPIAEPLPTARFIPPRAVQERVAARAFSDPLLLALRVLAIALLGAAVAAPIAQARRGRVARVVVIDRSSAVASIAELRDSVAATLEPGDLIVLADTMASAAVSGLDAARLTTTPAPGSLSAALAGGIAAAAGAALRADSVAMVLVSPLAASEADAATAAIRASWPAAIRVVQVHAAPVDSTVLHVAVRADSNDALIAAASLEGLLWRGAMNAAPIRVIRAAPDGNDIAWARAAGHTLVQWPIDSAPSGWTSRAPASDSVFAVAAGGDALVGALRRPWRLPALQPGQRVVARWIDGEPAVVETRFGAGCVRQVSVVFDEHSDMALRAPFRRLLHSLFAPCGAHAPDAAGAHTDVAAMLRGKPTLPTAVTSGALGGENATRSPLALWLLTIGALLLIVEMAVRRSPRRSAA